MSAALLVLVPVIVFLFFTVRDLARPPAVVRTTEGYEVIV